MTVVAMLPRSVGGIRHLSHDRKAPNYFGYSFLFLLLGELTTFQMHKAPQMVAARKTFHSGDTTCNLYCAQTWPVIV
jgi:hypothetical protein